MARDLQSEVEALKEDIRKAIALIDASPGRDHIYDVSGDLIAAIQTRADRILRTVRTASPSRVAARHGVRDGR